MSLFVSLLLIVASISGCGQLDELLNGPQDELLNGSQDEISNGPQEISVEENSIVYTIKTTACQ